MDKPGAAHDATEARPPKRRWRRWLLEALVVFALYGAITSWRERGSLPTDGATLAPPFELRSLSGSTVQLEAFRGKTVLLHFWAPWCQVCRVEMPMVRALHETLEPDQVLLTLVPADDEEQTRQLVEQEQLDYPVLLAPGAVLRSYGVSAFPTNYVIDADGKVQSHTVGLSTRLGLRTRMGCGAR